MKQFAVFVAALLAIVACPTARADFSRSPAITIDVTPVVSNGVAYTANDQVGGIQTLPNIVLDSRGSATLMDIAIVDKDKQSAVIDIFFFDSLPTVTSVDNGAIAMSAANAAKSIGWATIAAADYKATAAQSIASVGNLWKVFTPIVPTGQVTGINAKTIYAIAATRGTPTYTSTSALIFRYKFYQH